MEHAQLVAVVFEKPDLRIDLELEAVRARGPVPPWNVALGDPVLENYETAGFVRSLRYGVGS
jgi:hypothetical protein